MTEGCRPHGVEAAGGHPLRRGAGSRAASGTPASPAGRRKRRHKLQNPVTWECSTCRKPRGLRHTCAIRTDFKARKRAAARKRATAKRRQRRQLTAAKRKLRRQLAAADRRARDKARKPAPKRSTGPRATRTARARAATRTARATDARSTGRAGPLVTPPDTRLATPTAKPNREAVTMAALIDGVLAVLRWAIANPAAGIPLAITGRGLFVYFKPYRECRWCRRGGLINGSWLAHLLGHKPKRRPGARCWRCAGKRLTRRLGAWHMHKIRDSLLRAWEERQ